MIPELLRLISQIIGVNADTVAAHKSRHKRQEVPLGARRFQHGLRVNPHLVKYDGKFIHKRDIDISLAVLDDFCRLRHFDGFRAVNPRLHHQFVDFRHGVERLLVHAGHDFRDRLQSMYFVARIDPLGGVPDLEIHAACQTGLFLQNRHTDIFRHAGVHRGLKHHHGSLRQILPQNAARPFHRGKIRRVIVIDRRRHRHNVELSLPELCRVSGEIHLRIPDHLAAHFVRGVDPALVQSDLLLI